MEFIEIIFFIVFSIFVAYTMVFAVASLFYRDPQSGRSVAESRRVAVLIPAYGEDQVIEECVESVLANGYVNREIVVIADRMSQETLSRLRVLPIRLIVVNFENSTKAKALNYAMQQIGSEYDIVLILDADNVIERDFLVKINQAFSVGLLAVQAHRKAKNLNNAMARLDAVSEEINNSIFRSGHRLMGLSSALIGSAMAFEYGLFRDLMSGVDAVGGFDKELEHKLLERRVKIGYLKNCVAEDEKVARSADFSNQRRRWLSAQFHYLRRYIGQFPAAIADGNIDFADKIFQMMLPPRLLLLGILLMIATVLSFVDFWVSLKWWLLLGGLVLSLAIATPGELYDRNLLKSIVRLPVVFGIMALTLLRLRGANRTFIHTKHNKTDRENSNRSPENFPPK